VVHIKSLKRKLFLSNFLTSLKSWVYYHKYRKNVPWRTSTLPKSKCFKKCMQHNKNMKNHSLSAFLKASHKKIISSNFVAKIKSWLHYYRKMITSIIKISYPTNPKCIENQIQHIKMMGNWSLSVMYKKPISKK